MDGFHLMEQDLNPVRKWLVTSIMFMILLQDGHGLPGQSGYNPYSSPPVACVAPSSTVKTN